ncbi:IS3 family transposase, partial [Paenibacillus ginsengarvi]
MLGVSRSGFYKWVQAEPSRQELLKTQVMERISFHFQDTKGRYGSPKITHLLHQEGFRTTVRTVSSYMQ